eukprot:2178439-Prymnesium_polylepis.2
MLGLLPASWAVVVPNGVPHGSPVVAQRTAPFRTAPGVVDGTTNILAAAAIFPPENAGAKSSLSEAYALQHTFQQLAADTAAELGEFAMQADEEKKLAEKLAAKLAAKEAARAEAKAKAQMAAETEAVKAQAGVANANAKVQTAAEQETAKAQKTAERQEAAIAKAKAKAQAAAEKEGARAKAKAAAQASESKSAGRSPSTGVELPWLVPGLACTVLPAAALAIEAGLKEPKSGPRSAGRSALDTLERLCNLQEDPTRWFSSESSPQYGDQPGMTGTGLGRDASSLSLSLIHI